MDLHHMLLFSLLLMLSGFVGWRRSTEFDISKGTLQPACMISISFLSILSWGCFVALFRDAQCFQVMAPYNPNDQRGYAPNQAAVNFIALWRCL